MDGRPVLLETRQWIFTDWIRIHTEIFVLICLKSVFISDLAFGEIGRKVRAPKSNAP